MSLKPGPKESQIQQGNLIDANVTIKTPGNTDKLKPSKSSSK